MNKVEKQLSMIIDLKLWHMYPHICPHICESTHMCAHVHVHTRKMRDKIPPPNPLHIL